MQTNHVSTQQHRNGRPINMGVTSLLLGKNTKIRDTSRTDLQNFLFPFGLYTYNSLNFKTSTCCNLIRTTSKAQLAAHLPPATNRSNLAEPLSS